MVTSDTPPSPYDQECWAQDFLEWARGNLRGGEANLAEMVGFLKKGTMA